MRIMNMHGKIYGPEVKKAAPTRTPAASPEIA
jgi:hypothetical protein